MMRQLTSGLRAALTAAVLVFVTAAAAGATPLDAPTGRVVLEVKGAIASTNAPGGARFDLAMLDKLSSTEIATDTPWTDGANTYRGIPLLKLLEAVGASGASVKAVALNDYAVELPLDAPEMHDALVAVSKDGKPMRVKDKGPLWIVFPWSTHPELDNEKVRNWSIWQLKVLEVAAR